LAEKIGKAKKKSKERARMQTTGFGFSSLQSLSERGGAFFWQCEDSGIRELLVEVYTESLVADPLACSAGAE
jgi:hypothetical protein